MVLKIKNLNKHNGSTSDEWKEIICWVKSVEEKLKLSNFLKYSGYYFSTVDLNVKQNDDNTVSLIYDITLNKKAVVKINFSK